MCKSALLLSFFFVTLTGCMQTEEKVLNEIERKLKDEFLSNEVKETNTELRSIKVYIPEELEIENEGTNNYIFTDGSRPFVLFINEFEAPNSKWFFERLQSEQHDDLHLRSFESADEFVYLAVEKYDEEVYEVQIGIGGIKMSTLSEMDQLEEDVEIMLEMVKSVEEK